MDVRSDHEPPASYVYMWEKMGFALLYWATKCRRITSKIVRSRFRFAEWFGPPSRYMHLELDIHWLDQYRVPPGSTTVDLHLTPQFHLRMELMEPEVV